MPRVLVHHYGRLYGAWAEKIIGGAKSLDGLGKHFGAEFYESEVRYLIAHEWAVTPEDILTRRTKQGLRLSTQEQAALAEWFDVDIAKVA